MLEKKPSGGFDPLARVPLTEPYTRMPLPGMAPLAPSVSVRPGSLQSRMSASVTGTGTAGRRGFMMHPYSQGIGRTSRMNECETRNLKSGLHLRFRARHLDLGSMLPASQAFQIHCCTNEASSESLTLSLSISLQFVYFKLLLFLYPSSLARIGTVAHDLPGRVRP